MNEAVRVMREAGLEPLESFPGVQVPWRVRCLGCKEERTPRYAHVRDGRSTGCKKCSGCYLDPEEAAATMRAAGLEPLEPYPGSNKAHWKVRCADCKHVGPATLQQAARKGTGCRRCGGRIFDPDEMAQMMRDNGFEPLAPYPGVDKSWLCRCLECGHVGVKLAQNVRAGAQCGRCTGKILPAEEAEERMRAAGLEPLEPYPGRNTDRWHCRCEGCEAEIYVVYKSVMRGRGTACCGGLLDLRRPGRSMGVYLVVHPELGAAKVGVGVASNGRMTRLDRHRARGWLVVATWVGLPEPWMGFDVEKRVLVSWRSAGLPPHLSATDMPQAGHTETVQLDRIDLDAVIALVEDDLDRMGVAAVPAAA